MEYEGAPAAHKKKRAYAAQAYDFGAGANVAQQPPPMAPGVPPAMQHPDQLATQFGQMSFGGQPQQPMSPQMQAPPQQMQPPIAQSALNQLYPTDIMSQPVQAYEIDAPPPPINLPSNVRLYSFGEVLS